MATLTEKAKLISRFRKERYLLSFSEDSFRDEVVRPLLLRKGFQDGRDLCGSDEKGKDSIFISRDPLGVVDVYAVQTKKGKLNLTRKITENLVEATTQLKTALSTPVVLVKNKEKKIPTKAILCTSGKTNDAARSQIESEIKNPGLVFLDSDELIPMIDDVMPEFWFKIDSDAMPYLKVLKDMIENKEQLFTKTELLSSDLTPVASSEKAFVPIRLYRLITKQQKISGKVVQEPDIEQLPFTSIITKPHRLILVLGSAGSGKSTAMLRLVYTLIERSMNETEADNIRIPIFLRARDLSENLSLSLIDISHQKTIELSKKLAKNHKPAFTDTDLMSGRVFIMIDALDEVPDHHLQESIIEKITEFNKLYPGCQVIVTSRELSVIDEIGSLKGFVEYRISPIDYKQAQSIIIRLQKGQSLPVEKSSELLRRLQDVHGMELNPLLVTVFAASSDYSRADIPANITELFKKFTEMMLGRWDSTKGMALQYQAPLKDFVLTKIAFEMHRRKVTKITVHEFEEIAMRELEIRGYKAKADILIDEILFRSSLLRVIDDEAEFRHLMIQEFYAGRGIASIEVLESLIYDNWWRRAIVFYFGENPQNSDAFKYITDAIPTKTPPEKFTALVTLGLAIQACYLVKVDKKLPVFQWLIANLADIQEVYEKDVVAFAKFPLHAFINYYMWARDAVALNNLKDYLDEVLKALNADAPNKHSAELRQFWLIIGLIEICEIELVENLLKHFHPGDKRLLLGIHLGCFLYQHTRISIKTEREAAKRICESVDKSISSLRNKIITEFKTELLEIRKDSIKALAPPSDDRNSA
jgi:GTPase SAR1 family protein